MESEKLFGEKEQRFLGDGQLSEYTLMIEPSGVVSRMNRRAQELNTAEH